MIESDFHSEYGVDLETVFRVKSWRWFMARVDGLFAADTRLSRHFAPDPEPMPLEADYE